MEGRPPEGEYENERLGPACESWAQTGAFECSLLWSNMPFPYAQKQWETSADHKCKRLEPLADAARKRIVEDVFIALGDEELLPIMIL